MTQAEFRKKYNPYPIEQWDKFDVDLTALLATAREEEREQCCKKVCDDCRNGRAIFDGRYKYSVRGEEVDTVGLHHHHFGAAGFEWNLPCRAAAIRQARG